MLNTLNLAPFGSDPGYQFTALPELGSYTVVYLTNVLMCSTLRLESGMISSFSRISVALFLILATSTQASALTVYDVIQLSNKNYSDQDIIALVKATDSAFALKADDVSRLVE